MPDDVDASALRDLFDTAPCGFLVMNDAGLVSMANVTLEGWLGSSRHGLDGRPLSEILSVSARILFETSLLPLLRLRGRIEQDRAYLHALRDQLDRQAAPLPVAPWPA